MSIETKISHPNSVHTKEKISKREREATAVLVAETPTRIINLTPNADDRALMIENTEMMTIEEDGHQNLREEMIAAVDLPEKMATMMMREEETSMLTNPHLEETDIEKDHHTKTDIIVGTGMMIDILLVDIGTIDRESMKEEVIEEMTEETRERMRERVIEETIQEMRKEEIEEEMTPKTREEAMMITEVKGEASTRTKQEEVRKNRKSERKLDYHPPLIKKKSKNCLHLKVEMNAVETPLATMAIEVVKVVIKPLLPMKVANRTRGAITNRGHPNPIEVKVHSSSELMPVDLHLLTLVAL